MSRMRVCILRTCNQSHFQQRLLSPTPPIHAARARRKKRARRQRQWTALRATEPPPKLGRGLRMPRRSREPTARLTPQIAARASRSGGGTSDESPRTRFALAQGETET